MDHFTYELGTEKGGMANRQRVAGRRITLPGSLCAVTERRASATAPVPCTHENFFLNWVCFET